MADKVDIDKLWNHDDPAESERRFRDLLTQADGTSTSYKIEILTQIARAQGLQDNFTDAHATLAHAHAMLAAQPSVPKIRWLLEKGRVFNSAKEPQSAAPLFVSAWEMARQLGEDFYAIDAAHMLGICMPPAEAMDWNKRAIDAAEASAEPRARNWRAPIYNNMAWTCFDQGDFPTALDLFQHALFIREELKQPPQILIAKWCVARTLRSLGRIGEALEMQELLAAAHQAAGTIDKYVIEELAECRRQTQIG